MPLLISDEYIDAKNLGRFSVIIPCYNAENYILSALSSLERQTYRNFEVIIINDGSIDNTEKVILQYIETSNLSIKYKCKDHEGVSIARNLGLQLATGEYITFLDADDAYLPNCLETFHTHFSLNCVDMVIGEYKRSHIFTDIEFTPISWNENGACICICFDKFQLFDIFTNRNKNKINLWSCAYKKELIDSFNLTFYPHTQYGEDSGHFRK